MRFTISSMLFLFLIILHTCGTTFNHFCQTIFYFIYSILILFRGPCLFQSLVNITWTWIRKVFFEQFRVYRLFFFINFMRSLSSQFCSFRNDFFWFFLCFFFWLFFDFSNATMSGITKSECSLNASFSVIFLVVISNKSFFVLLQ